MKTIILAGGFSTRLYPLTKHFPKALLKVKNKEILQFTIQNLESIQKHDIVLISNNRFFNEFSSWMTKNHPKIKIINNGSNSPEGRLGAIGDLLLALEVTDWNDDLLVLASDTLTSLKLKDFVNFFASHKGIINAVFNTKDPETIKNKLGCVKVNENHEIIEFTEKPKVPKSTLTSIPFYIFPKKSIPLIKKYKQEGNNLDAPGSIISWLINRFPIYAFEVKNGYYFDIGTKEALNRVNHTDIAY